MHKQVTLWLNESQKASLEALAVRGRMAKATVLKRLLVEADAAGWPVVATVTPPATGKAAADEEFRAAWQRNNPGKSWPG